MGKKLEKDKQEEDVKETKEKAGRDRKYVYCCFVGCQVEGERKSKM